MSCASNAARQRCSRCGRRYVGTTTEMSIAAMFSLSVTRWRAIWRLSKAVSGMEGRPCGGLLEHEGTDHERVERRRPERLDRVARGAHDRLAARVERRVDQNRHAGAPLKGGDQIVVERMLRAIDGLNARRAVDMSHRRDQVLLAACDV